MKVYLYIALSDKDSDQTGIDIVFVREAIESMCNAVARVAGRDGTLIVNPVFTGVIETWASRRGITLEVASEPPPDVQAVFFLGGEIQEHGPLVQRLRAQAPDHHFFPVGSTGGLSRELVQSLPDEAAFRSRLLGDLAYDLLFADILKGV